MVISDFNVEEWFHTIILEGNEAEFAIKSKFLDFRNYPSPRHCEPPLRGRVTFLGIEKCVGGFSNQAAIHAPRKGGSITQ